MYKTCCILPSFGGLLGQIKVIIGYERGSPAVGIVCVEYHLLVAPQLEPRSVP